jgi:hypothetical protein
MKKPTGGRKGGKKGCLCDDGTYNSKCCDGDFKHQGIGEIQGGVITNVGAKPTPRTKNVNR